MEFYITKCKWAVSGMHCQGGARCKYRPFNKKCKVNEINKIKTWSRKMNCEHLFGTKNTRNHILRTANQWKTLDRCIWSVRNLTWSCNVLVLMGILVLCLILVVIRHMACTLQVIYITWAWGKSVCQKLFKLLQECLIWSLLGLPSHSTPDLLI